jgi:hypothetical protein
MFLKAQGSARRVVKEPDRIKVLAYEQGKGDEYERIKKIIEELPPFPPGTEHSPMNGLEWWWYSTVRDRILNSIKP